MTVRRRLSCVALLAALALTAASGCSESPSGDAGSSSGDTVTLDMTWWGNPVRAEATEKAVTAFEAAHPNIDVKTASATFDGYHDRLSVQIAANDAPDVMQLQGEYMVEYGTKGALLPLTKVDTSQLEKGLTANGLINDQQVAVPTGMSTLAIVANPEVFKEAGVPLPTIRRGPGRVRPGRQDDQRQDLQSQARDEVTRLGHHRDGDVDFAAWT